ncbi:MAG: FixH family protein [Bacillota bacterium]
MRRKFGMLLFALVLGILSACSNGTENEKEQVSEEPKPIEVEFIVPEKANVGEKLILKAIVTYGEEKVKNADEVKFEYWEKGNKEGSTMIEANNNGDGTYTAEVIFEHDGVYEMYAHTTAKGMHTMPKKQITIGEGANTAHEEDHEEGHQDQAEGHEHGNHAEGFGMHFMKPEGIRLNQQINLTVHLQLDNEPLKNANVRYEIFNESNSEKHDWVETKESASGEYTI